MASNSTQFLDETSNKFDDDVTYMYDFDDSSRIFDDVRDYGS